MAKPSRSVEKVDEILDILIGEVALSRRKFQTLMDLLDEKGIVSKGEFQTKFKEKTAKDKLEMLIKVVK